MDIGTYCIPTESYRMKSLVLNRSDIVFSLLPKEEIFLIGIFIAILIMTEPKPLWLMIGIILSEAILKHSNTHL